MCYTCGCGMPDEDHGDPKRITNKTFKDAASADEISDDQAKMNALETLQEQTGKGAPEASEEMI